MGRKRRDNRPRCAKIGWDTIEQAEDHVKALRIAQPFDRFKVYPCKCGRYHVAHDRKRRKF